MLLLQVLAVTFDGASVTRRLVALHDTSDTLVYKLHNMYADENRFIYCFSDPPHLIKTVRNCWSSKNRSLWVSHASIKTIKVILFLQNNGKYILWQHLIDLYERDHGKGTGLSLVPKLKYEHLHLTSFSKMRVDLAAQVCHFYFYNYHTQDLAYHAYVAMPKLGHFAPYTKTVYFTSVASPFPLL